MTTEGPACPSDDTLKHLVTGKLDDHLATSVFEHLEACETCQDRLEHARLADDSFCAHKVAAAGDHLSPPAAFDDAAREIRSLLTTASAPGHNHNLPDPASRYSKVEVHATGGAGQIWRTEDCALGREVALKELRPDQKNSKNTFARFLNEARVTGQLSHPGIVPVYDVGFTDEKPFYTMKLVQGKTLHEAAAEFADQRGTGTTDLMPLRRLVNAVISVANTVGYAHSQGVLHRDLKGKNIVLGEFGEVLVLDWGLARLLGTKESDSPSDETLPITGSASTTQTEDGSIVGTPAFMSPEQAMGKRSEMNERTDVYGLGAVLYQVLTGKAPFGSGDSSQVLHRVLNDTPALPRTHWPIVPRGLESICMKALEREQSARYESATAFANDLEHWLADEPISAHKDSFVVTLYRWGRRNQTWVAATSALLVTTLIALATSTILISREQSRTAEAQARAEANFHRANQTASSLLDRIGDPRLADVVELTELRAAMLEEAIAFNQEFLKDSPLPSVRFEAAQAHGRIAAWQMKLGKPDEAIKSSRSAVALLQELQSAESLPERATILAGEVSALSSYLDAIGKTDEATIAGNDAIRILRSSRSETDTDVYQIKLAQMLGLQAAGLSERGSNTESEDTFRLALTELDKISQENKNATETLKTRADINLRLSMHLRPTNRTSEAIETAREAVALLDRAAKQASGDQSVLFELNQSLNSLGSLLRVTGKRQEAREYFERAVAVNEKLVEQFPYAVFYRKSLVDAYTGLGISFAEAGDRTEAEAIFRKSLEAAESLTNRYPRTVGFRHLAVQSRRALAISLINTSRHADALPLIEQTVRDCTELSEEVPDVLDYRYLAAISLGNLAITQDKLQEHSHKAHTTILHAAQLLESLCEEQPRAIKFQHKLGIIYRDTARLFQSDGKSEPARNYFEKAINVHRRIVALEADKPRHKRQLGIALFMLGRYCLKLGLLEEAEPYMKESLEIRRRITGDEPNWIDAKMDLVLSHIDLGELLAKKNDLTNAETTLRTGAAICKEVIDANLHGEAPKREYAEMIRLIATLRIKENRFKEALDILQEPINVFRSIRASRPDKTEYSVLLRRCLANLAEAHIGLAAPDTALKAIDDMLAVEPIEDWGCHLDATRLLLQIAESDQQENSSELRERALDQLRLAIDAGLTEADLATEDNVDSVLEFAKANSLLHDE